MPKVAALLEELTGLRFRDKKASAFGSYGWNGGAVDRVQTRLMDAGFETTLALKLKWRPDGEALAVCREHGREIARQWALHPLEPIKLSSTPASAVDEPCAPKPAVNSGLPFAEPVAATCAADKRVMQCSVCQWLYDPAIGAGHALVSGSRYVFVPRMRSGQRCFR